MNFFYFVLTTSVLRRHFRRADTTNDSKINLAEVHAFLDSINLKLKKDQIQALIQVRVFFIFYKYDM